MLKKYLQVWGYYTQIFRGLAALEPPQNGGQKGSKIDFFHSLLQNDLYTKSRATTTRKF